MIENIRKYTVLIVILFVFVIIGFIFMDTSAMRSSSVGGRPYIKVAGRTYTDSEFVKIGESPYQIVQSLAQSGDYQLLSFLFGVSGEAAFGSPESQENFFSARILIRKAKEEFGVYPSDEEIDTYIRKLRVFTGTDGAFSTENYGNFINKGIGRLGLSEGDIRSLVSDVIAQEKIAEIIGSGLSASRDIVVKTDAIANQRINLELVRLDIDPIKEKIAPTEEEIKTYWETVKDAFKTQEKRKFSYFTLKPTYPQEPADVPALAEGATDEAKAEYEKAKATRSAEVAEQRRKAQLESGKIADDFLSKLEDDKEITFDQLVTEGKIEIKTTELVTNSEAPADLKAPLRSSSSKGTAIDELFKIQMTSDPVSKISPAVAIGEDEWLIARLDEVVEARTQTFDEARDEARARLIADKGNEALKTATEAAITSIKASLNEGKTFTDAAKAAGCTNEIVALKDVSSGYQGDTMKSPKNLFDVSKYNDAGSLTEAVIESDRSFIIHVISREVTKQENAEVTIDSSVKRQEESLRTAAFGSWIEAKIEAAKVEKVR